MSECIDPPQNSIAFGGGPVQWLQWLQSVAPIASTVFGIVVASMWILKTLFILRDRYDSIDSPSETDFVIRLIAEGAPNVLARFGCRFRLWHRIVADISVLPRALVFVSKEDRGIHGQTVQIIDVWRLRGVPALAPGPEPGEVDVIEREDNNTYSSLAVVRKKFDHSNVPKAPLAYATRSADRLLQEVGRGDPTLGFPSFAVIMHGRSGLGKSITADVVATMLSMRGYSVHMYKTYNPTKKSSGHCLREHIRNSTGPGSALVICINEIEEPLTEIIKGNANEPAETGSFEADADRKSGWNDTFDGLRDSRNVILIGSTNLTKAGLSGILPRTDPTDPSSPIDISYVREGRILWNVVEEKGTPLFTPPIDAAFALASASAKANAKASAKANDSGISTPDVTDDE